MALDFIHVVLFESLTFFMVVEDAVQQDKAVVRDERDEERSTDKYLILGRKELRWGGGDLVEFKEQLYEQIMTHHEECADLKVKGKQRVRSSSAHLDLILY